MNEEEESAMLLGSIYGDLAGLMQEDSPPPPEPIHFSPYFDHARPCDIRIQNNSTPRRFKLYT